MTQDLSSLDGAQWERLRQALASEYELLEEVGSGGMALVFRARDLKHDRTVALKVLRPELSEALGASRFLREIKTAANLQHPSIVPLYDSGEAGGYLYYVMPFVEGSTLKEKIEGQGPLSVDEALAITGEVADALDHAHQKGLLHRDIKPANILFQGGRAVLADFGLATAIHGADQTQLTQSGIAVGTPLYMSPEQASGKGADRRSDLYSLGCVVYEMLAGDPPFSGSSAQAVLARHQSDVVPPVRSVRPQLPKGVDRTLAKALAKVPADRFASARQLVEALRAPRPSAPVPRRAAAWALTLMLAVTLSWILWPDRDRGSLSADFESIALTTSNRYELDPHWSPGGDWIAFGRMTAGSVDLYLQPVPGGDAQLRVDWAGDEVAPRWSPDGSRIAFVSSQEVGSHVWLMDAHRGDPWKLIETNIGRLATGTMSYSLGDRPWSLDGTHLLVSRMNEQGRLAIHKVPVAGGEAVPLSAPPVGAEDMGASYSGDGQRIAFCRQTLGRGALWVMSATGENAEVILEDEFTHEQPTWREGDRHLVFHSDRGGGATNLWDIDLDTQALHQLTFESTMMIGFSGFSVSQNDRIAFAPVWHDTTLTLVDPKTGERRGLTDHIGTNLGARFSPDGRSLAYHASRDGNAEIYLHHLDGSPETRITDHPGEDLNPDWSPDGTRLTFVSDRDGTPKIYMVNTDRAGGTRLVVDQAITQSYEGFPIARWSPDGSLIGYIVATEDRTSLWCVRPDGSDPREIVPRAQGFDWYRDSQHVVITESAGGRDELHAVNLVTGDRHLLWVGPHTEIDVAPDGHAVLLSHGAGHFGMGLWFLPLDASPEPDGLPTAAESGLLPMVRPNENWHVHDGSWSFDSTQVVFTHDRDYSNVYERVDRK